MTASAAIRLMDNLQASALWRERVATLDKEDEIGELSASNTAASLGTSLSICPGKSSLSEQESGPIGRTVGSIGRVIASAREPAPSDPRVQATGLTSRWLLGRNCVPPPCRTMVAAPQAPLRWSGVAEGGPTRAWARIWRQTGRSQLPTARPKWPEGSWASR